MHSENLSDQNQCVDLFATTKMVISTITYICMHAYINDDTKKRKKEEEHETQCKIE
jgi:uncharacterized protein (DUF924 family)